MNEGTLGDILKEARRAKGLSIAKAAAELRTTRVTYRGWEQKGQEPDLKRVGALSRFAGRTEDDILEAIVALSQAKGVWLGSPLSRLVA